MSDTQEQRLDANGATAPTPPSAQVVREAQETIAAALQTLKSLASSLQEPGQPGASAGREAGEAGERSRTALEAARNSSRALFQRARSGSDHVQHAIRREPIKAVLIAASGAAVLATLLTLALRTNGPR